MTRILELQQFHEFAVQHLANAGESPSLEELLREWRSLCEREEVNEAVRESLLQIDHGETFPNKEVLAEAYRRLES